MHCILYLYRFWSIYYEILTKIMIFDDFTSKNPKRRSKSKKTNPDYGQKIGGFQDFTSYRHGVSNIVFNRFPLMSHLKCRVPIAFPSFSIAFPSIFYYVLFILYSFFIYFHIYFHILPMNCLYCL